MFRETPYNRINKEGKNNLERSEFITIILDRIRRRHT